MVSSWMDDNYFFYTFILFLTNRYGFQHSRYTIIVYNLIQKKDFDIEKCLLMKFVDKHFLGLNMIIKIRLVV